MKILHIPVLLATASTAFWIPSITHASDPKGVALELGVSVPKFLPEIPGQKPVLVLVPAHSDIVIPVSSGGPVAPPFRPDPKIQSAPAPYFPADHLKQTLFTPANAGK